MKIFKGTIWDIIQSAETEHNELVFLVSKHPKLSGNPIGIVFEAS